MPFATRVAFVVSCSPRLVAQVQAREYNMHATNANSIPQELLAGLLAESLEAPGRQDRADTFGNRVVAVRVVAGVVVVSAAGRHGTLL